MIKEVRSRELSRKDVYERYLQEKTGVADGKECSSHMTEEEWEKVEEMSKIFKGKTKLEIMIRGTIQFDKDFKKLFTFLNKTYDLTNKDLLGFESALYDLDLFDTFMEGNKINYFSEIENEYVNYTRVLNAYVMMELT